MKRLFTVIFAFALIFMSCGKNNEVTGEINIKSISFCSEADVTLKLDGISSSKGYVIVKEEHDGTIDESDVILVSENEDIASVKILSISRTLIQYEIIAVSPGETTVFAQSVNGDAVSEKIKVIIEGDEHTGETSSAPTEDQTNKITDSTDPATEEIPSETTAPATEIHTDTESESTATSAETIESAKISSDQPVEPTRITYIINKSSKKIHLPSCSSASKIKSENYGETNNPDEMLAKGYEWCKRCHK